MTIDAQCVNCECDFEVDIAELMEDGSRLVCPNCEAAADPNVVEDMMGALDEVIGCMAQMRRKFRFSLSHETDEMKDSGEDEEESEDEEKLWDDEEEIE